jgi:TonB family protein
LSTDDQIHQAAIRGPRSPMVPGLIGAIVGAGLTFVFLHFNQPPPTPPPAPPPAVVAAAVPCVPNAPEATAAPAKVKKSGGSIANLLGRIDPVAAAPERAPSQSLDRDALGRFIRERLPSIRVCYDRELKLNPSLKGKVVVRFDVTPAGRVGNGAIESDSMNDERVSRCILTLMKGWSFPFHPSENTTVSFPFVFQPGS